LHVSAAQAKLLRKIIWIASKSPLYALNVDGTQNWYKVGTLNWYIQNGTQNKETGVPMKGVSMYHTV